MIKREVWTAKPNIVDQTFARIAVDILKIVQQLFRTKFGVSLDNATPTTLIIPARGERLDSVKLVDYRDIDIRLVYIVNILSLKFIHKLHLLHIGLGPTEGICNARLHPSWSPANPLALTAGLSNDIASGLFEYQERWVQEVQFEAEGAPRGSRSHKATIDTEPFEI